MQPPPGGGGTPRKIRCGCAARIPKPLEEGKARSGEGRRDEEVASSKKETELKTRVQKAIPYL